MTNSEFKITRDAPPTNLVAWREGVVLTIPSCNLPAGQATTISTRQLESIELVPCPPKTNTSDIAIAHLVLMMALMAAVVICRFIENQRGKNEQKPAN